jgi:hypothetical protein
MSGPIVLTPRMLYYFAVVFVCILLGLFAPRPIDYIAGGIGINLGGAGMAALIGGHKWFKFLFGIICGMDIAFILVVLVNKLPPEVGLGLIAGVISVIGYMYIIIRTKQQMPHDPVRE